MLKVKRDEAASKFEAATEAEWFTGVRIKSQRDTPLKPGGRTELTLFEKTTEGGRAHPRMRFKTPPAKDPAPRRPLLDPTVELADVAAFRAWIESGLRAHQSYLAGADLKDHADAPAGSERYFVNSIRAQRIAGLFEEARARLDALVEIREWGEGSHKAGLYALAEFEDESYAGDIAYDDTDTGTYHSYGKDEPFVHYLETILASLPAEGTKPFAVLPPEQQSSVRTQRLQVQNHLDHLMRHKYANHGVEETNIEQSVGGFLIDRKTRHIVSETAESADTLVPTYELLRIRAAASHDSAGAYVYRDGDLLKLDSDHGEVTVDEGDLRRIPVDSARLTFRRAPKDDNLRADIRLDWDNNGYVQHNKIGWVGWAGHCDIKAIMESLGVTLIADKPQLAEYRADTGATSTYDTAQLIEMVASAMELGSTYQYADDSGSMTRGIHRFGGFRNDSRPDRLQFKGLGRGRHFRWPLSGRQDVFRVTSIEDAEGAKLSMDTVFFRNIPDTEKIDFEKNPRYLKTVEGDYNLIDVTGHLLTARVKLDSIDPASGYPVQTTEELTIDLRAEVGGGGAADQEQPPAKVFFLGTNIQDAANREIHRLYLDRSGDEATIIAKLFRWTRKDGSYVEEEIGDEEITIPLVAPASATLSREMKRDDPSAFQELLKIAARTGQSICTDTDMKAEVWNGVVTNINAKKLGSNTERRVEHWLVKVDARFGKAELNYLVRRRLDGTPAAWCPAVGEEQWGSAIDFLWQDFPDVASKGKEDGEWIVNRTMLNRDIINIREAPHEEGGFFVEDDHIKNMFELIYAGLGGFSYSVVHNNKRYGFETEEAWKKATAELRALRDDLSFSGPGADTPWPVVVAEAEPEPETTAPSDPSGDSSSESDTGDSTAAPTDTDAETAPAAGPAPAPTGAAGESDTDSGDSAGPEEAPRTDEAEAEAETETDDEPEPDPSLGAARSPV